MKLPDLQKELIELSKHSQLGCGDGGCQIRKPTGMHTNGGCQCSPKQFQVALLHLAEQLDCYGKYKRWEK